MSPFTCKPLWSSSHPSLAGTAPVHLSFSSAFCPYRQHCWWPSTSTVNTACFSFGKQYSTLYFIILSIQMLQKLTPNPAPLVAALLTRSKPQLGSPGSRELTAELALWHSTAHPWKGWDNTFICKSEGFSGPCATRVFCSPPQTRQGRPELCVGTGITASHDSCSTSQQCAFCGPQPGRGSARRWAHTSS